MVAVSNFATRAADAAAPIDGCVCCQATCMPVNVLELLLRELGCGRHVLHVLAETLHC
jgi:hypothetical protein